METTLLQTKLYIPKGHMGSQPNSRVARPHLIQKLNNSLHGKLTLISAPAGYGKTTLVADWLSQLAIDNRQSPIVNYCWLSLDDDDNDVVRFWAYAIAALQTIDARWGVATTAILQNSPPTFPEPLITTFINEIADNDVLQKGFVLVLDDYHLIHNQNIHAGLVFLLRHMPTHMHLVLISRADPPFPLPRWRVRGVLTEIRDIDLRFNASETAVFLNQIMQLDLPQEDIVALESRTEGWVASLQLAALAMQSPTTNSLDRHQFVTNFTGSDRYIVDYLIEEVLQQQSPLIREFLLETAVLDRLCASLCDHLRNNTSPSSSNILVELDKKNLFLIPMDNQRHWYRYHHLFGDLLRFRLQEIYPGLTPILHKRASRWYAENGFVEDAITHALKAQDFEKAAQLIEQSAHDIFGEGKMMTLQYWLKQLPPELIYARQGLYLMQAWLLLRAGLFNAGADHLQHPLPTTNTPYTVSERAEISYFHAFLAYFRGDFQHSITLCEAARELLPPGNYELQMPVLSLLAWTYEADGDLPNAIMLNREVAQIALKFKILTGSLGSLGVIAYLYALQDKLQQAEATAKQAINFAIEQNGNHVPLLGLAYLGLGLVNQKRGDWQTAFSHLRRSIDLCQQWGGLIVYTLEGYRLLVDLLELLGESQQAQEVRTQLLQLTQQPNIPKWKVHEVDQKLGLFVDQKAREQSAQLPEPLTKREREILRLMVQDLTSSQIADQLVIGVSTVRTHIKRIYSKLNAHSRHEALAKAREFGLIVQ